MNRTPSVCKYIVHWFKVKHTSQRVGMRLLHCLSKKLISESKHKQCYGVQTQIEDNLVMKENEQFGEKKDINRSKLQNRGVRLRKYYKVNNLKNNDISVVCS